ncbi:unnamed protein product, partial [Phaeothamnion confervicola]
LDDDVTERLAGRALFDAQQALKGKPTTLDEAAERAKEAHAFEREGLGNAIGDAFVDTFSDKGQRFDKEV